MTSGMRCTCTTQSEHSCHTQRQGEYTLLRQGSQPCVVHKVLHICPVMCYCGHAHVQMEMERYVEWGCEGFS